jgi:hypothetical protein
MYAPNAENGMRMGKSSMSARTVATKPQRSFEAVDGAEDIRYSTAFAQVPYRRECGLNSRRQMFRSRKGSGARAWLTSATIRYPLLETVSITRRCRAEHSITRRSSLTALLIPLSKSTKRPSGHRR